MKNNKLQYVSFSALLKKDLTNPFSVQHQQINASNVEKKDTGQRSAKKEIPHDSAWLQRQRCYTCGEYGRLKKDCQLAIRNGKLYENITFKVKDINIDHDPLTIQLLRLPEVNVKDHPKLIHSQPCDGSGIHHSERLCTKVLTLGRKQEKEKLMEAGLHVLWDVGEDRR